MKNPKILLYGPIMAIGIIASFYLYESFVAGAQANTTKETIIEKIVYLPQDNTPILKEALRELKPSLDQVILDAILINTVECAKEFTLPKTLILAIIERESKFNPLAMSSKGAAGLMQVMLKVHQDKVKKLGINNAQAMHIANNIRLGCTILKEYLDSTKDIKRALKKYVGGAHATYYTDVLSWYTTINMLILEKQNIEKNSEKDLEKIQNEQ
jgi:soluble lytic murein transglycosylase-like protein